MKQLEINQLKATKYAKELEQNATLAETILKEALFEYGIDFEFQKPLYSKKTCYIADFYIYDKRLVVELDGSAHKGREEYDAKRTKDIRRVHGFNVLRFKNKAVFADVVKVIHKIQDWKPYKPKSKVQPKPKPPKKKRTKQSIKDPLAEKRARVMAKVFATQATKEQPFFISV
jgi:very-short-patch-repair endonuclease